MDVPCINAHISRQSDISGKGDKSGLGQDLIKRVLKLQRVLQGNGPEWLTVYRDQYVTVTPPTGRLDLIVYIGKYAPPPKYPRNSKGIFETRIAVRLSPQVPWCLRGWSDSSVPRRYYFFFAICFSCVNFAQADYHTRLRVHDNLYFINIHICESLIITE